LELKGRPVPQGRLELSLDEILDTLQPSLPGLIWALIASRLLEKKRKIIFSKMWHNSVPPGV
jgi:hypothetical protein